MSDDKFTKEWIEKSRKFEAAMKAAIDELTHEEWLQKYSDECPDFAADVRAHIIKADSDKKENEQS